MKSKSSTTLFKRTRSVLNNHFADAFGRLVAIGDFITYTTSGTVFVGKITELKANRQSQFSYLMMDCVSAFPSNWSRMHEIDEITQRKAVQHQTAGGLLIKKIHEIFGRSL